jgi:hypothetical protein
MITLARQTEREVAAPVPTATDSVGIDVGIARFETLNGGNGVGAMNILERRHRLLACGEAVSCVTATNSKRASSVKQEPTEGIMQRLKPSHEPVGIPVL